MSKKYTAKDLYMEFNVAYTLEDDRNTFLSFEVIAKSIDKALEKAKHKLNYEILKDNQMPIITSIEFMEYVNSKGHVLCVMEDGETWEREEDWENRCEKKAKESLRKEMEKPVDKSCWYINPFDVNKRVFNENGDIVELNSFHSDDDYKFFKELHLVEDNVIKGYAGTSRYIVCPMLYECVVYGHNYRYGYIKDKISSLTEAINYVRIHYTKLRPNDDPRRKQNDEKDNTHM